MFRFLTAAALGLAAAGALAAPPPPKPTMLTGVIRDVRGIYGQLTLRVGEGARARDLALDIKEARVVGVAGAEWKVGDLREGDRVEVKLAADGRTAREVRVLPARRRR
jgi:putative ubiquitin-RnfH superfamily antitoxin RatB of RatAB toxin-antitoxin module